MTKKVLMRMMLITIFGICLFPLIAIFTYADGKSYVYTVVISAIMVLVLWCGAILRLFFHGLYKRKPQVMHIIFLLLMLLLGAVVFLLTPLSSSAYRFFVGVMAGGILYIGGRLIFQPLERLTSSYVFTGVCTWIVICGIIWQRMDNTISTIPMIILLAVFSLLFAAVYNWNALEQTLQDRDAHIWKLPKEIVQSNRRQMTIFCIIGAIALLCFQPLAKFFRWLGKWILTGLWYLLRWLFSLGGSTSEETTIPNVIEEQVETVANRSIADWVWPLIGGIGCVGLIILVIRKRKMIKDVIRTRWKSFRRWVAANWKRSPKSLPDENCGYCDYVEDLLIADGKLSRVEQSVTRRNWNRGYRQFSHHPWDMENYRLGYQLLLAKLPSKTVLPSDTPAEILVNLQEDEVVDERWITVTEGYEIVRYGESLPSDNQFQNLESILTDLKKQK